MRLQPSLLAPVSHLRSSTALSYQLWPQPWYQAQSVLQVSAKDEAKIPGLTARRDTKASNLAGASPVLQLHLQRSTPCVHLLAVLRCSPHNVQSCWLVSLRQPS